MDRKWIGIDISKEAEEVVKKRFQKEASHLKGSAQVTRRVPQRTDGQGKVKTKKKTLKQKLYGRQNGTCLLCLEDVRFNLMELDHIIPKSKGGSDYDDNIQLLCSFCNKMKGNRSMEEARKMIKEYYEDNQNRFI